MSQLWLVKFKVSIIRKLVYKKKFKVHIIHRNFVLVCKQNILKDNSDLYLQNHFSKILITDQNYF